MNEFIAPNWHAFLIHAPLGLLGVGIVVEILKFLWPQSSLRSAGRWMIALGSLLAVPALTAGIYALRNVMVAGVADPGVKWYELLRASRWTDTQWELMSEHILLMSVATAIFLAVTVVGVAACDKGRKKLYWPLLLTAVIGMAVAALGAWNAGEAVYRHGVSVDPSALGAKNVASPEVQSGLAYYIPPLELHMVLAGLAVAAAIGALAISMRRWHELPSLPKTLPLADEADNSADMPVDPVALADEPAPTVEQAAASPTTRLFPGRLWLAAMVIALVAVVAGAWTTMDCFSLQSLKDNWAELHRPENLRLTVHAIGGVSIVAIALILAALVRFAPRRKALTVIFAAMLALVVTSQIYGGTLILFDSQHGPLTGFSPAPANVVESKSVPASTPASQSASAAAPADIPTAPTSAPAKPAVETPTTGPTTAP